MIQAKKLLLVFILGYVIAPAVQAEPGCRPFKLLRGVESGGAGTVLMENDRATLLDFLWIDRNFRDTRPDTASFIATPRTLIYNRYEGIVSVPDIAFTRAFNILGRWQKIDQSVTLSPSLEFGVLKPTTWLFSDEAVCRPADKLAQQDPRLDLKVAAYYLKDRYQVNILRPLWNKMGLKSQAGLIIHESLRHVQIGLKREFTEDVLQKATALLVLCEPKPILSRYIQHILNNNSDLAQENFGTYPEILQECTSVH